MNTRIDSQVFADRWISGWNRNDVEAVLAHFSDNVIFRSPRAKAVTGSSTVEGKSKLGNTGRQRSDELRRFALLSTTSSATEIDWGSSMSRRSTAGGFMPSSFLSLAATDLSLKEKRCTASNCSRRRRISVSGPKSRQPYQPFRVCFSPPGIAGGLACFTPKCRLPAVSLRAYSASAKRG